MVVIVSVGKVPDGSIQAGVAKPQHSSKPAQSYISEKEAQGVLLSLGIADEAADFYLFKLLSVQACPAAISGSGSDIPSRWTFLSISYCQVGSRY